MRRPAKAPHSCARSRLHPHVFVPAASKDDVLLQLLAEQKLMREALDAMKVAQDRKDFERLFIEPVRHTSGS